MTKIPFTFSTHFDLAGNHSYFLRELVPRPPSYSLFYMLFISTLLYKKKI